MIDDSSPALEKMTKIDNKMKMKIKIKIGNCSKNKIPLYTFTLKKN